MGHFFVFESDIRRLDCDAWLLPCDQRAHVRADVWLGPPITAEERAEVLAQEEPYATPLRGENGTPRVRRMQTCNGRIWLANVASLRASIEWVVQGAEEFVRAAAAAVRPNAQRKRPLLAVPLVGTAHGGKSQQAGEVTKKLVPAMLKLARELDVDIALVTREPAATAAAQQDRLNQADAWPELSPALRRKAEQLARRCDDDRLVLFLGAGVSIGAGLDSWPQLVAWLASAAGMASGDLSSLKDLSLEDQASLIARRKDRQFLLDHLEARLSIARFSLAHGLLANLPFSQAVTMNFDRCFELASAATHQEPPAILPWEPIGAGRRFLLKLHGCLAHKDDIVFTREDYLGYDERRGALVGLVQAMLLTRHMLFIGFSLTDSNFIRLVHEVRRALPAQHEPFGTAMLVDVNPLRSELWNDDLDIVDFGSKDEGPRLQAIFLDYLVAKASVSTPYLLDERYEGALAPHEQRLAGRIRALLADVTPGEKATAAWRRLEEAFEALGATRSEGRRRR